ncbi:MAG: glycosyltransferase family 2 protein [Elusimicrobiota bacterium]
MKISLSVFILATNEEEDLSGAIESVGGLADEVVVVDGGSTDRTRVVAERAGARVVNRLMDNFTAQRQFALAQVRGEWVLSLDADERVSSGLAGEIRGSLGRKNCDGWLIPFKTQFMGRALRFGGAGGEKHLRLFRKDKAALVPGRGVHEEFKVPEGRTGVMAEAILHRPYKDLGEYMSKCEFYTALAARDFVASGKKLTWRYSLIPVYEFLRSYVFYFGFLDGLAGLVWAVLAAYHRRVRHEKIRMFLAGLR